MFNSLVLTWERNFEVTFSIFLVLVFQISVFESYLNICFKISYDQKFENCVNLGLKSKFYQYFVFTKKYSTDLSYFCISLIFTYLTEVSSKLCFVEICSLTKELIFGFQILDLEDHLSTSLIWLLIQTDFLDYS